MTVVKMSDLKRNNVIQRTLYYKHHNGEILVVPKEQIPEGFGHR